MQVVAHGCIARAQVCGAKFLLRCLRAPAEHKGEHEKQHADVEHVLVVKQAEAVVVVHVLSFTEAAAFSMISGRVRSSPRCISSVAI